eukprot:355293-Chlamydomonas_euryale.AAC.5
MRAARHCGQPPLHSYPSIKSALAAVQHGQGAMCWLASESEHLKSVDLYLHNRGSASSSCL